MKMKQKKNDVIQRRRKINEGNKKGQRRRKRKGKIPEKEIKKEIVGKGGKQK